MELRHLVAVVFGLYLASSADAFMADMKDAFGEAKSYLGQVYDYLEKGVKAARRVEEFIDSTLAEECPFECPKGMQPVPRENHVKSSNGCGSLDVFFDDSADSLLTLEKDFVECCNSHDFCYDTCLADKDLCDLDFRRCLYSTCKTKRNILDEKKCKAKAKLAFLAVMGVGCQSFRDAQKDACVCAKRIDKDEL